MKPEDTTDEQGRPLSVYKDAADQFSDDAYDKVTHRASMATANWLFAYGVPKTPRELLGFAQTLAGTLPSALVVEGIVTVTDEFTATPEQVEGRAQAKGDPLATLAQSVNGQNAEQSIFGAYL